MQISVNVGLQNPFSYYIYPLIVLVIMIIIWISYFSIKNKKEKIIIKEVDPKDLVKIKEEYIEQLNNLIENLRYNQITIRKAYQKLSKIIRLFIYEVTDINVQNYTLKEIKKINMPKLYKLIQEYYAPEFSRYSLGNIEESIEKTRKVIEEWN